MEGEGTLSEAEFYSWLTPRDALARIGVTRLNPTTCNAITARVQGGLLRIAAEVRQRNGTDSIAFWIVPPGLWQSDPPSWNEAFWNTGDYAALHQSYRGSDARFQLFGIRFEPAGIERFMRAAGLLTEEAPSPPKPEPVKDLPPLSTAEAERFCRAILLGWPDCSQDFAHEKAVLFYPENKVSRDWFRSILRSIRGHTKPGKKPKTGL